MKNSLIVAAMALGTFTSVTSAKNILGQAIDAATGQKGQAQTGQQQNAQEPAAMHQAIEKAYPGAKTQIQGERDENGTQVYEVLITPKSGQQTIAVVTAKGDFLSLGNDLGVNQNLPPDVQEFAQGIWKNPPTDVRAMESTYYYVTVGATGATGAGQAASASNHTYELRLDPTGRLTDIKSPDQIHHENWQSLANAPADVTSQLQQFVHQRYAGSTPVAVKTLPHTPGFYQVRFTLNGGDGWVNTDTNHNIADEATTVPLTQLPTNIQDTLRTTFNGDHVIWAARGEVRYYQLSETVGNEKLTLRVQPNGNVLSVRNADEFGRAIPASARRLGNQK